MKYESVKGKTKKSKFKKSGKYKICRIFSIVDNKF